MTFERDDAREQGISAWLVENRVGAHRERKRGQRPGTDVAR
jgi:hypothetical protein